MSVFRKIWHALFPYNTRFEIRPFALLPTISRHSSFSKTFFSDGLVMEHLREII